MRKILNSNQTREIAKDTIAEIAAIVGQTLGPGGLPIILQMPGTNPDGTPRTPVITKDGVSVAEHVVYRNAAKNTIAQAVIQVAKNTVNQAGDGTTTAIVLANAMFQAGYKHLTQGQNGIQLYEQLKECKNGIIESLEAQAIKITKEDLINVARISANGDEEVAQIVSQAIADVGEDGHVSLEDGFSRETTFELVKGAMYKQGWRKFGALGSLMVNDKVRNVCELERPAVVLYAGEIKDQLDISNIIAKVMGMDENSIPKQVIPIVFIAYDFSDEVKNHIMQIRIQGKLPIAAIKAPFDGSPNARTQMLEDLAVLLGGQITARGIVDLKDITDEHLGCCEKIEIGPEETVFFTGLGNKDEIEVRIEDLKKQLNSVMHEFDKENLRLRIGKLVGGIAVIRVGGDSELEMKERKDRIEDALCAAKVAILEGIIPGGGYTLYRISQLVPEKGITLAEQIMKEALQAPIKQIIDNVGENSAVVLAQMPDNKGYDARKKEYVDLMATGVVDPLKVTKSALENAVSIVGLLLTTGGAIVADTESKDGQPNPLAALMGLS